MSELKFQLNEYYFENLISRRYNDRNSRKKKYRNSVCG